MQSLGFGLVLAVYWSGVGWVWMLVLAQGYEQNIPSVTARARPDAEMAAFEPVQRDTIRGAMGCVPRPVFQGQCSKGSVLRVLLEKSSRWTYAMDLRDGLSR